MMEPDYQKLGFKAGIEIHQELNTKKLFCDCLSEMREDRLVAQTSRKLRAVAGETGEIDSASAYEQFRNRVFIYHAYKNEACLVELDEEPPHEVNPEAFAIALGVGKLFRLKIPDTLCVMRKTVTDGSAVSGFQRTILAGIESEDSFIETEKGKVKILQLNLEEDSSKIEKKEGDLVYYSLSRLGIPLLEIGTDASLKDPEHVKEAALEIGTILRSFNVKRGIGSIRQDVNVSIRGGTRIEVKGWQDLRKLEDLVKNEVMRQYNLLQIKKELEERGLKKVDFMSRDVTPVFDKTESKIISDIMKNNGVVTALLLPKFSGMLKKELCPGKTFGRELSEYAKAYGTKGMIHTDEDISKYKLDKEFNEIRKILAAKDNDLIILIAEKAEIAQKAVLSVFERASYCLKGVPEETRVPNHHDATSSYARPLPGAHRLYPETDTPNLKISAKYIDSIKIPELISEKIDRFSREYKVDKVLAKEIVKQGYDFERFIRDYRNIAPAALAQILCEMPKEIKKRYGKEVNFENEIEEILDKLDKGLIVKEAVFEILVELASGKKIEYNKYSILSEKELEKEIENIIYENRALPPNALIGKCMEKLRGRADGKKIVEIVNKSKKNYPNK